MWPRVTPVRKSLTHSSMHVRLWKPPGTSAVAASVHFGSPRGTPVFFGNPPQTQGSEGSTGVLETSCATHHGLRGKPLASVADQLRFREVGCGAGQGVAGAAGAGGTGWAAAKARTGGAKARARIGARSRMGLLLDVEPTQRRESGQANVRDVVRHQAAQGVDRLRGREVGQRFRGGLAHVGRAV